MSEVISVTLAHDVQALLQSAVTGQNTEEIMRQEMTVPREERFRYFNSDTKLNFNRNNYVFRCRRSPRPFR